MNKEEILAASRKENKQKDPAALAVYAKGNEIGMIVGVILAFAFYAFEIFMGRGQNYGFFALILAPVATGFIYRAFKLKRKTDIISAIIYTLWAALCVVGYFLI